MDSIGQGALAGFIAAVATAAFFGIGRYGRDWLGRRRDANLLSDIISGYAQTILDTEDKYFAGPKVWVPADTLRTETYNQMLRMITVCLEKRITFLRSDQIAELYRALDWYHTEGLYVTKSEQGEVAFQHFPEGQWPPGATMNAHTAREYFNKLRAVSWLSLGCG